MWQTIKNLFQDMLGYLFPRPIVVQGGNMSRITVAVLNASTVLTDAEIEPIVLALQIQISRDFAPIYGTDATLIQVKKGQTAPTGAWQLVFLDDSDTAGALGYHDMTPDGLPMAKIFAKTDQQYGNLSSVTASHELVEMLADSGCELTAQVDSQTFTAYEIADPVESDSLGYMIVLPTGGSVKVSNFVYPSWFKLNPAPNAKFDKCGSVSAPFTLATGGYMSLWTPTGGWGQRTNGKDARRHPVGSRIEKRMNKDKWQVSNLSVRG